MNRVTEPSRRGRDAANIEALGWLNGRLAIAVPGSSSARIRQFAPDGSSRGAFPAHGIVRAIKPKLVVAQ